MTKTMEAEAATAISNFFFTMWMWPILTMVLPLVLLRRLAFN